MAKKANRSRSKKAKMTSNFERLFGTTDRAAKTIHRIIECCGEIDCRGKWCPLYDICSYNVSSDKIENYLKQSD